MRESEVERHLQRCVEQAGGLCWKFNSQSLAGVPDRMVILNRHVVFVELKAPGEQPRRLQKYRMRQLKQQGMEVIVVDSKEIAELVVHLLTRC